MKVYIVQESYYHESEEVLGVYSTLAKASEVAKQAVTLIPEYATDDAVFVVEAELDAPIKNESPYVHGHALVSFPR